LLKLCDETRAHPVKEYLEGLEWDQQARLETFLIAQAGVDDSGLNRAITSRWMIQAIARIYQPGCQADATLILEGDQGIGKSSLLRILFGQWHTETLPDLGSKDAMLQLRGVWCVELAELATLGKADQNRIKAFLTTNRDQYRPPYGRMTEWVPRSNVFAGTVNPGGGGYLKDATGARRFWPIEIRSPIDRDAIMEMRDQLWAEALYQYRAGQPWHLADATLITDVAEAQAKRFEGDPWEERITDFILNRSSVTVIELLGKVLNIEAGRWTQGDQNRVAKILTHHGWVRKQRRVQGKPQWLYVPKTTAATGDGSGDRPAI
jgi:predicted P-loop ATPase